MALRLWLVVLGLIAAGIAWAAQGGRDELFSRVAEINSLLAAGSIKADDVPNPHWRDDGCGACHKGKPSAGQTNLRTSDINRLCLDCHETISAHNYIHAVGMKPSTEKQNRMPENFRQAIGRGKGVLTCIGCHDLPMQCQAERRHERKDNPLFFRGGPYTERTTLCFSCHDPSHYERLNPHDQITDEGELNTQVCLVCHAVVPNRREVRSINDVSFNAGGDLNKLCLGCHPWKPHPAASMFSASYAGPNPHLVKPPEDILERMQDTQRSSDIILPLEPDTGKIVCATCHNPHERGVQVREAADRGADGVWRLRAATNGDRGCTACHPI